MTPRDTTLAVSQRLDTKALRERHRPCVADADGDWPHCRMHEEMSDWPCETAQALEAADTAEALLHKAVAALREVQYQSGWRFPKVLARYDAQYGADAPSRRETYGDTGREHVGDDTERSRSVVVGHVPPFDTIQKPADQP